MVEAQYTHQEKEQIFEQFKLLPEGKRIGFLSAVTNNPDVSANPNLIAAGMQSLINQHVAEQSAHPFAALLAGQSGVLASFASMQGHEYSHGDAPEGNRVAALAAPSHDGGKRARVAL